VSVPANLDRVVVTGGTGFIGQHVVRALRERGSQVRILLRPGAGDATPKVAAPQALGAELVEAELTDTTAVERALEGATALIHLAGRLLKAGVPDEEYARVHVEATRSVLDACAHVATLRAIVHCSTTGVLGPTGPQPACEDAPQRPSNVYERTKAEGERVALAIAERHGLRLNVARPALVYGPGDVHLLGWFRAIRRGHYRVVGKGDNTLHPIYVDDCVQGLLRCAETPTRRAYNLVGERAMPIREMASAIAGAMGRRLPGPRLPVALANTVAAALEAIPGLPPARLPLTRSRVAFMTESRAYCGCRARDELGFVARVGIEDGLRRTVAWYRAEGLL
jgi:nucleoside-diphosphate-sugar epimerase